MNDFAAWLGGLRGWRQTGMAGMAGALAALALPPFDLWPILLVSFSLMVWLLDGTSMHEGGSSPGTASAWRRAFWIGWWFGFGYFLAGLYWIGYAFLVDADNFAWLIPFVAVLLPGGLALFTAAATLLARVFWAPGAARLIMTALSFVLFEWLRGHVLTGFPWNLTGYAWAGSLEILQVTSVTGIYGLSLLTVLAAVSPAALWGPGVAGVGLPRRRLWPALALTGFAALWLWGHARLERHQTAYVGGVFLRLVQPSVPQAEKWRPENRRRIFDRYVSLTEGPGYDAVTHVIWPETAVPIALDSAPPALREIGQMLGPSRVLISGSVRWQRDPQTGINRPYNALQVIRAPDANNKLQSYIIATYDKTHLVPFGEYLPMQSFLEWIGLKQLTFGAGSGFAAGPGLVTLPVPGAPDAAPLICYEIIFSGAVIAPGTTPGWIINLTNDAWFGDTSGPRQHLGMAVVRAIESGLPVARSANTGISAIVDPYGRIIKRLALNVPGVLDGRLPRAASSTVFRRWGVVPFLALFLGFAGMGGVLLRRVRSKRTQA